MSMKTERLQVLIEASQRSRLEQAAAARGVSVAHLVRSAIDVVYPPDSARRAAAATAILGAEPMPVPDVDDLRAERTAARERA